MPGAFPQTHHPSCADLPCREMELSVARARALRLAWSHAGMGLGLSEPAIGVLGRSSLALAAIVRSRSLIQLILAIRDLR